MVGGAEIREMREMKAMRVQTRIKIRIRIRVIISINYINKRRMREKKLKIITKFDKK
jgi:hypothetical protein